MSLLLLRLRGQIYCFIIQRMHGSALQTHHDKLVALHQSKGAIIFCHRLPLLTLFVNMDNQNYGNSIHLQQLSVNMLNLVKVVKVAFLINILLILASTVSIDCPIYSTIKNNLCVKCTQLDNTAPYHEVHQEIGSCPCKEGYTWSENNAACLQTNRQNKEVKTDYLSVLQDYGSLSQEKEMLINTASMQSTSTQPRILQNTCNNAQGYVNGSLINACISCKSIPFSTGVTINSTTCVCQGYYSWSSQSQQCKCRFYFGKAAYLNGTACVLCALLSSPIAQLSCTLCNGYPYGQSSNGCVDCNTIPYGVGTIPAPWNESLTTCRCQTGYAFSFQLAACVCDIGQGYSVTSTGCTACSTYKDFMTQIYCSYCLVSFYYNNVSCQLASSASNFNLSTGQCNVGYSPQPNLVTQQYQCACSNGLGYYLTGNGSICLPCNGITGSSTVTVSGCRVCSLAQGFFLDGGVCVFCQGMAFSTGSPTINGCGCLPNYFWNYITFRCQCDWVNGYSTNGNSCVNCSNILNTILSVNGTSCNCLPGYKWNASTLFCDCDTTAGSFISTPSGCYNCQLTRGSIGKVNGSTCSCLAGFVWDTVQLKCVCDYNQNFYLNNGICYDCLALSNTNNYASALGCGCANGLVWNSSTNACTCPVGYVMMSTACVICSQAVLLLSSGANVNGCTSCSNTEGFTLNNGICYPCSTLQLTTGAATSNGCVCRNISLFWVASYSACACNFYQSRYDSSISNSAIICNKSNSTNVSCGQSNNVYVNGVCMQCAGIPFSNGLSFKGACMCYSGYKWSASSYPFQCICSYSKSAYIKGNTCMNCTTIAPLGTPNYNGCILCSASQGFLYIASTDSCILCSAKNNSNGQVTVNGCGCKSGMWSQTLVNCINCPVANCQSCNKLTSCLKCATNYTKSADSTQCLPNCNIGNCQTCATLTACQKCNNNYLLSAFNTKCLPAY